MKWQITFNLDDQTMQQFAALTEKYNMTPDEMLKAAVAALHQVWVVDVASQPVQADPPAQSDPGPHVVQRHRIITGQQPEIRRVFRRDRMNRSATGDSKPGPVIRKGQIARYDKPAQPYQRPVLQARPADDPEPENLPQPAPTRSILRKLRSDKKG